MPLLLRTIYIADFDILRTIFHRAYFAIYSHI